jgi:hypothetical protein
MANRWTLDTSSVQENFFADTSLIGISSSLPAHRFCWVLNNFFDIDLIREYDLDICLLSNTGQKIYFPIYQYALPLSYGRYIIYKLKNRDESLIPEIYQLDYLWLLQITNSQSEAEEIIQQLRNIEQIQLAQLIFPDKLKNISNLLI